jgi:hypothetical protein
VLGTDGLVFTPAGGGGGLVTAPSVTDFPAAGEPGKVYLAEDSGDTYRFDATAKGTDTYVRISETTVAAKIEDSTEVGRDVITAADKPSGRAAIEATDVRIDGVNVSAVELDMTPLTAHDVGAYTQAEVDDAIEAAKNAPVLINPTITDANLKKELVFGPAANAVNYYQIYNAATGQGPVLAADGSDANVDNTVMSKGTGQVRFRSTGGGIIVNAIPAAGAVNYLELRNNSTGKPVQISAAGGDASIPVEIQSKNTGSISLRGGTDFGRVFTATPVTAGGVNFAYVANATTGNAPVFGVTGADPKVDLNLSSSGTGAVVRANSPVVARGFRPTSQSTATAGGLTALNISSDQVQIFTGTANGRVGLPTTSVTAGLQWTIINNSIGVLTVESSNASAITTIPAGKSATFMALADTPTLPEQWSSNAPSANSVQGSAAGTPTPLTLWTGTKAQYDAIPAGSKSATTLYVLTTAVVTTGDITSEEGI